MSTKRRSSKPRSPGPKRDVYQDVTDKILTALANGVAPWQKPWNVRIGPPRSLSSGKPYQGTNALLTGLATLEHGYSSPYWGTFDAIQKLGGNVKGQKGTLVIKWLRYPVPSKDDPEKKVVIPVLKHFWVFNLDQATGIDAEKLPADAYPELKEFTPAERHEAAAAIVKGFPGAPPISHGGDRAFYRPEQDTITVPTQDSFDGLDEYYSTLFHEMGHSTGHKSRLDRWAKDHKWTFGSHDYGREELVAEMTSAFLQAQAGIELAQENSAAYLGSWIETIKEDPKIIVWAATRAQKAADHILDRHEVVEEAAKAAA